MFGSEIEVGEGGHDSPGSSSGYVPVLYKKILTLFFETLILFLYLVLIYLQQKFTTYLSQNSKVSLKLQIPSGALILHLVCKLNEGFSRLCDSNDYIINEILPN